MAGWRLGYSGEYLVKKKLIEKYGKDSVQKIAIGGLIDFFVIEGNRIVAAVEVKTCHAEKYYSSSREKIQFEKSEEWCKKREIPYIIVIYYPKKRSLEAFEAYYDFGRVLLRPLQSL